MNSRVVGIRHEDGTRGRRSSPRTPTARAPSTRATTSSRRCRSRSCCRRWTRRPPTPRCAAADDLRYRDFLTVALVVPEEYSFPDNWIYVHSKEVQVGRIQNFGSWSPYLVKEGRTCLGLEYFVFEGDEMWTKPDDDLDRAGQARARHPRPGRPGEGRGRLRRAHAEGVSRSTTSTTRPTSARIVEWLRGRAPNVHPVGRNGMHQYNNQDHSMFTAMLTVENIAIGAAPRRLGRQRRGGVPRGGRRRRRSPLVGAAGPAATHRSSPRHHYGDDHPVNRPAAPEQ